MEEGEGRQKMSKFGILGFIECQYGHIEDAKHFQVYFPLTSKHEVLPCVNIFSPLRRSKTDLLQRNSLPQKVVKDQFHTSAMVLLSANPVQLTG